MTTETLADLANEAAAVEAAAAPAAAPDADAPPPADVPAEVAALVKMVAGMLTPAFPCLAEIYNEATCQQLGAAAAPVMDKYGLSVGGLFDRWGAEITLAAVALPVGLATMKGVKADIAARNQPVKVAAPAPDKVSASAVPVPAGALVIPSPSAK